MPEIERDKIRAMLAEAPEDQHEALLTRLKERGYTVKDASTTVAQSRTTPSLLNRAAGFVAKEGLPIAGMMAGGAEGATLGTPLGPLGMAAGAVGGAAIGGMSGRAATSGVEALENAIKPGMAPTQTPEQVIGGVKEAGKAGAEGEMMGRGAAQLFGLAGKYGPEFAKEYTPTFAELGAKATEGFKNLLNVKIPLTAAEITQSPSWASMETMLAKMPISSGMLKRFQDIRVAALAQYRNSILDVVGSRISPETLGESTRQSIADYLEKQEAGRTTEMTGLRNKVLQGKGPSATPLEAGEELQSKIAAAKDAMRLQKNDLYKEAGKHLPEELSVFPADNLRSKAREILKTKGAAPSTLPGGLKSHLEDILKSPQGLSWGKLHDMQSDYGSTSHALYVQNKGFQTTEGMLYGDLQKSARKDMETAATRVGGDTLEKYKFAQAFNKSYRNAFDNDTVNRFLKTKPDKVYESFVKNGSIADLKKLKSIVQPADFGKLRKLFVEDIVGSAEDQVPSSSSIVGKLDQYKYKLKEMLPPDQVEQIKNFSKTGEMPKFIQSELEKKMATISRKTPQAVMNTVMQGDPTISRTVKNILGPKGWEPYRRELIGRIIGEQETGLPTAKNILKQLDERNMSSDFRKLFISDAEVQDLKRLADVRSTLDTGERLYGNPSGTAKNIITWELSKAVLHHPVTGVPTIIAGPLLAKFYLSPMGRRLLINGLNSSTQTALFNFTRLTAFALQAKREILDEERKKYGLEAIYK